MDPLLPTVLIVEDDPDTARTLAMLLWLNGFQARVARDGRQALRAVRGWEPDVVLLDLVQFQAAFFRIAATLFGGSVCRRRSCRSQP
jgi:DNA-binding response OmpR family regulator